MRKAFLMPVIVCALAGLSVSAYGQQCTCDTAKAKNGWCDTCKEGYFDGVEIKSKKLYDAVQGQTVDAKNVKCDGCKKAVASNGTCDHCHVGVVAMKVYPLPIYFILQGDMKEAAVVKCDACKKNMADHGWCDACKVGVVGNECFKDKAKYEAAVKAHAILVEAAQMKCDGCAVALVMDGTCAMCKVSYKNGKKANP